MIKKYPRTKVSKLYLGEGIIRYTVEYKDHWYSTWRFMMDGSYPRLFREEELELLGIHIKEDFKAGYRKAMEE